MGTFINPVVIFFCVVSLIPAQKGSRYIVGSGNSSLVMGNFLYLTLKGLKSIYDLAPL